MNNFRVYCVQIGSIPFSIAIFCNYCIITKHLCSLSFNRSSLDIQNRAWIVMQLNENLIRDREEDNRLILEKHSTCQHGVTGICRDASIDNNPIRVLRGFLEITELLGT